MKRILILSGLDPTGASGLLLDVLIAARFGIVASAFPTCLVAENYRKVDKVVPTDFELLEKSVELCLEEGSFDATKIGLVPANMIEEILRFITENKSKLGFVVIDPVLSASSGYAFHQESSRTLKKLIKAADISVPNLNEFKQIFQIEKTSKIILQSIAEEVYPSKILVTSFKRTEGYVHNLLLQKGSEKSFRTKLLPFEARGTGCALSTLISVNIAKGLDIEKAVTRAMKDLNRLLHRSVPISNDLMRIKVY